MGGIDDGCAEVRHVDAAVFHREFEQLQRRHVGGIDMNVFLVVGFDEKHDRIEVILLFGAQVMEVGSAVIKQFAIA